MELKYLFNLKKCFFHGKLLIHAKIKECYNKVLCSPLMPTTQTYKNIQITMYVPDPWWPITPKPIYTWKSFNVLVSYYWSRLTF